MATVSLYTSPQGSQFTQSIGMDDPADLNDFDVYLVWNENVDLTQAGVSVSTGSSIQAFEGSNSVYKVTIRPPETAGTVTVTIAADAVSDGNAETSLNIRVSTSFPDADADIPTQLFNANSDDGIAVTPTRILISDGQTTIKQYTHAGVEQTSEEVTLTGSNPRAGRIDYFNGKLLASLNLRDPAGQLFNFRAGDYSLISAFTISGDRGIVHTDYGVLGTNSNDFVRYPYDNLSGSDSIDIDTPLTQSAGSNYAHQNGLIYATRGRTNFVLYQFVSDTEIALLNRLNIGSTTNNWDDLAIYRDTLYLLENQVYTLDIRPYRPLSLNTKTSIPVQFADEGDTIDLKRFCPDANRIIFDTGFDKPSYLSINSSNQLAIDSNAVTETTPVLVKLRGINYIDTEPFSFYLVIEQATAPSPRDVDNLSMPADSTYDLHQIVDADSITFETGQTQPTGTSIANGILTIGTVGGTVYLTATKDSLSTDFQFNVDVVQAHDPDNFSDVFRYKVEIAGIDVSADVDGFPEVSKSLDAVQLNVQRTDGLTLTLVDEGGKYSSDITDNFWDTNSLNPAGFNEEIKVYLESFVNNAWVESLLFFGIINDQTTVISEIQVQIRADDISALLRNQPVRDFGTSEKWDGLRQQSDEAEPDGVYVPERSLLPMQPETGAAWEDRTVLTLQRLALPSEGPPQTNTAYLTASELRTSGGFLGNPPILKFKTFPHQADVRFLINQLALNTEVYNTEINLPSVSRSSPFILNRGSVPFSVEDTRTTRLITDWVYDSTNKRILMLLGNPEGHIADVLVEYRTESDSFRTLYTFSKSVKAHRIERRSATLYYILTSDAITQDRSAATLPRTSDKTAYAYDARAEGSNIRIHRYNSSSNTLTEFVPEDDDRPPQLGIHYHAGFENTIYIDEFEGIVPAQNSGLIWYSSNLYYRYCTGSEFGIARVNTGGTTSEMIDQTDLNYWNWLNFAFDINTSNGTLYFVYATGDADSSTLVIKSRTSGGTEATVLEDEQDLDALTDLDDGGGAYLGCHEALFHDDNLYMVCPIQRVDEDSGTYTRSQEKSAGAVLYKCDVTAASPSLTVIAKYDFVQLSACNLVIHDGNVHYTEQPRVATIFRPINKDL